MCRLRHGELLDAAHIVPDASGGVPHVSNGLSLCEIRHAAYDANILGVRPDLIVVVRERAAHVAGHVAGFLQGRLREATARVAIRRPASRSEHCRRPERETAAEDPTLTARI
jgi:putative restriction endonuclease